MTPIARDKSHARRVHFRESVSSIVNHPATAKTNRLCGRMREFVLGEATRGAGTVQSLIQVKVWLCRRD
jgi:hypothetical protein